MGATCGSGCLQLGLPPDAYALSVSVRPERSMVVGDRVVRTITTEGRFDSHPFSAGYMQTLTLQQRLEALGRLRDQPVPHVLTVTRLCQCSFEAPFLHGAVPLQDFGLGPDASKLMHPSARRLDWPPATLTTLLRELAQGLASLHEQGLVHGDSALMNAMVDVTDSGPEALWVDLNSLAPATAGAVELEISAFVQTCLWPALLDARHQSASLVRELVEAIAIGRGLLQTLVEILGAPRADFKVDDGRRLLFTRFRETKRLTGGTLFHKTNAKLTSALAPTYFLDQTKSDQTARFYEALLRAERERQALLEEERTRLHYHRFSSELAELRSWTKEVEAARDYHRQRADSAEAQLAEHVTQLQGLQRWTKEVEAARDYHRQRADSAEARAKHSEQAFEQLESDVVELVRSVHRSRSKLLLCLRGLRFAVREVCRPGEGRRQMRHLWLALRSPFTARARDIWGRGFSAEWYLCRNLDVAASGIPPSLHYLMVGYREGREPSPGFSGRSYLERNPDVALAGLNPLAHFAFSGAPPVPT